MEKKISGVMAYYYKICERKLWYFCHHIAMEQNSENVAIGKVLDETTYNRERKHISIDNLINIDFIHHEGVIHEVKKSKNIEDASVWQLKYYLYYLESKGIVGIKGKIDYPLLRKSIDVKLEKGDYQLMKKMILDVNNIIKQEYPPKLIRKKICKKCAFHDLCFV
ncbi:CRISPR-associated protein Cas4 [Alkaliphilus sp. AH-315-G20]|nr:CRISPR-associated protein Cas4 [Alkaliphilus sp. AH-315-G20]